MVKPLHVIVLFKIMREHILERNPVNVIHVVKSLHVKVFLECIKKNKTKNIVEPKPTNVMCVLQSLQITVIFNGIKEQILERNPRNVISVVKPLHSSSNA